MCEFLFGQVYFIIIFDPFSCILRIRGTCQGHKPEIAEFNAIIHLASKTLSHTLLGTSMSGPWCNCDQLDNDVPLGTNGNNALQSSLHAICPGQALDLINGGFLSPASRLNTGGTLSHGNYTSVICIYA
jgi:hypothetical protein